MPVAESVRAAWSGAREQEDGLQPNEIRFIANFVQSVEVDLKGEFRLLGQEKEMDRFTEMRIFVAVAKLQSFTRAADSLGMNTSTVSKAIADLETRSNTRLVHRTTRRVCLTDAAHVFYERCESILAQVETAESTLKSDMQQLSGTLRLILHPGVAALVLPRILGGYKARAPQVALDIGMSDTRTDIVASGYDVGILPSHLIANTTAVSRSIGTCQRILVASTSYLVSHGRPHVAADLHGHTLMHTPEPDRRAERKLVVRNGMQTLELNIRPTLCADDAVLQLCAMAGMGIALVSADLVNGALLDGALEHVLPDYTIVGAETQLCLVYPSREFMAARTRVFIDYCMEHLAERPAFPNGTPSRLSSGSSTNGKAFASSNLCPTPA
jgi:DNA-binding transcriptional LysR family regulator